MSKDIFSICIQIFLMSSDSLQNAVTLRTLHMAFLKKKMINTYTVSISELLGTVVSVALFLFSVPPVKLTIVLILHFEGELIYSTSFPFLYQRDLP